MSQPLPQLFGIIPTGLPPIITPSSAPSQTSYIYTLPAHSFAHICVFILPGITLPPNSAAAVYMALPPKENQNPTFKFLGGIGPGKESAIFKINNTSGAGNAVATTPGEIDMDAPADSSLREIVLGIDLESAESVTAQIAALSSSSSSSNGDHSQALVLSGGRQQAAGKPDTLQLAQRIIKNAFNFLASFSGNVQGGNGGVEVVPLKAFEDWWRKFEGRVRSDPGFLERDGD